MNKLTTDEVTKMRIKRIEKEIRDTPYHKGTEHHIGRLRAKLSKLKDTQKQGSKGGGGVGYAVKKQGDATIVLVGPPSAGKSTLLNKLTNAKSKIAPYSFTTLTVVPGMMEYMDAKIQILDVPGLIEGAEEGKGRGREVISVVRGADLVLIMSDVTRLKAIKTITEALWSNGVRLNQNPPDVVIEKKLRGGMVVHSNINQEFDKETVREIAKEFGYINADITIKEKLTIGRLIDAFSKSRVYIPSIVILNKGDQADINNKYPGIDLIISAEKGMNISELKDMIWGHLGFIRVYLVKPGDDPSMENPMIMKQSQNLSDVALSISEEFAEGKTRAKIWGSGSKYPGQEVSLNKEISEGMQIRFV